MRKARHLIVICVAVSSLWTGRVSAATIRSVQSGTATSTGNGTTTVNISSVDTSKSFLVFQTRHNSNRPTGSALRGRLASATTLEFVRVTDETSTIDIQWYVAEFSSGVKVQRGSMVQNASTVNATITAVASVSQAFVTWSKTPVATDAIWGNDDPVVLELTSVSNLQMRSNYESSAHTVWWQVVEFTNAADILVQKGSTSLTGTNLSVDATLSTTVNTARAFVLAAYRNSASSNSAIGRRLVRARLINGSTIRFDRDIADAGDTLDEILWQVVELRDGAEVQHGSVNFATGTTQQTIAISPVDTARAIAFASAQPAGGQNMGKSPYASDDIIGVASATFALSGTSLAARRSNSASTADIAWQVVEFAEPCAAPASPRATVVLVVPDADSLGPEDAARRCAMYAWNLDVDVVSQTATSAQLDAAIATARAVYVSASVSAAQIDESLTKKNIGIIWEARDLDDDLKLSEAGGAVVAGTAVNIASTCHYITSGMGTGSKTILTESQSLATVSSPPAEDATILARHTGLGSPMLAAIERHNRLAGGTRANGRRVRLPWGGSDFEFTALNSDGQTLARRAIEWAAELDGTLGIWRFDESGGYTAYDSSGNGRNATLTNMDPATDWVRGRIDNALDFDGTNDRAVVAGSFPPPGTGTVAFFMKVPGPPALHGRILGVGGNWEVRHVNAGNPDGVPYGVVFDLGDPASGANTQFITTTAIDQPNRWYHLAGVFNQSSSTYAVYLDGELHKSGTKTLVLNPAGTLTIGTRTGSTEYYVGKIDDLRIYDRELCADEIAALARARSHVRIVHWMETGR